MVCSDSWSFQVTLFKNWLKHIFALTAYVWEAAPFTSSTLPTADESAVTESVVTTAVSSSLFQSATVDPGDDPGEEYSPALLQGLTRTHDLSISRVPGGAALTTELSGSLRYH